VQKADLVLKLHDELLSSGGLDAVFGERCITFFWFEVLLPASASRSPRPLRHTEWYVYCLPGTRDPLRAEGIFEIFGRDRRASKRFMPARMWKVMDLPSGDSSHLSALPGANVAFFVNG